MITPAILRVPCCSYGQHVRLPPRGVVRFLCRHVLKLEFWHFAHPELNFRFVFASVSAVFSSKNATAGGLHCTKTCSALHFAFFSGFSCVCGISQRFSTVFFADSRLSAHAGFDLHLSFSSVPFSSVRGWMGGWGGGGSGDDVHANAACVFCFLCCVASQTLPVAL